MALKNLYLWDNNTNDSFGSSNGTAGGSPAPSSIAGPYHQSSGKSAYDYAGGNNGGASVNYPRITLVDSDFDYADSNDFSLLVWFNADVGSIYQTIFANIFDGSNGHVLLWLRDTDILQFQVEDTSNNSAIAGTTGTYADQAWHMVVASWDSGSSTATLNVDNGAEEVSDTDGTVSGNLYSGGAQANLGAWLTTSSQYKYDWDGKIGLFANFDHVLTDAEIRDWYLRGKQVFHS